MLQPSSSGASTSSEQKPVGEVTFYQAPSTWVGANPLRETPHEEFIVKLLREKHISSLAEGEALVHFISKFRDWRNYHNLTQEKVCKLLSPQNKISTK